MMNENFKKLLEAQGIEVKDDGIYVKTGVDLFGLLTSCVNESISVLETNNETNAVTVIKSHFGLN